jgi:hypothetical protein
MQWRWTARTMHEDLGGGAVRVSPPGRPARTVHLPTTLLWVPVALVRGVHVSDLSPASEPTAQLRSLLADLTAIRAVETVTAPLPSAPDLWVRAPQPLGSVLAGLLELAGGRALPVGSAAAQGLVTAWHDSCDPDLVALAASRGLPVVGIALLDGAAVVSSATDHGSDPSAACARCLDLALRAPSGPRLLGAVGTGRAGALDPTLLEARSAAAALGRMQSALSARSDGPAPGPFLVRGPDGRDDAELSPVAPHPWCEACPPRAA